MTNRIDTAALRRAHQATTQGVWRADITPHFTNVHDGEYILMELAGRSIDHDEANARFIALAHEQWPALLDEIERLRAQVEADRDTFRDADIIDDPIGAAAQLEAGYRKCMAALGEPMPPPPEQGQ